MLCRTNGNSLAACVHEAASGWKKARACQETQIETGETASKISEWRTPSVAAPSSFGEPDGRKTNQPRRAEWEEGGVRR